MQCQVCKGTGLILRQKGFKCPSNTHISLSKTCMYCENANKSLYVECDACLGTGIVTITLHDYKSTGNNDVK